MVPTHWAIGRTVGIEFPNETHFSQETATIVVLMANFKQIYKTEERQTTWQTFPNHQWQEAQ